MATYMKKSRLMNKQDLNIPYPSAYLLAITAYTLIFIPPLWLFLHSIDAGMSHIDLIYPYPQNRQPLHSNPFLIYTHMYSNILALGLQLALLTLHPPQISRKVHGRIAWTYAFLVTIGTAASMLYASRQNYGSDGGKAGTFAFGVMAAATMFTLCMAVYFGRFARDGEVHREWAVRNFAVLFGNAVFFRVLANTYLVWMVRWGAEFYAAWCQMIYLAWVVPLFIAEWYLAWERSSLKKRRGEVEGKG